MKDDNWITYELKYWEGNQLLSLSLDAQATHIVVDGTFKVTLTYAVYHAKVGDAEDTVFKGAVLNLSYLPENASSLDTSRHEP